MVKISDTYNPITGEYVKKISDWVELTGDKVQEVLNYTTHKAFKVGTGLTNVTPVSFNEFKGYKYSSVPLLSANTLSAVNNISMYAIGNENYGKSAISLSNEETGFGGAYVPTLSEAKAYFFGHRMANSDGSSPYYKSEAPYTPATWAEWLKLGGSSVVADSTGVTLNFSGEIDVGIQLTTSSAVVGKKYGFLYNVISVTAGVTNLSSSGAFSWATLPAGVGNQKATLTATNPSPFTLYHRKAVGESIKFKDIRIFELPTGSQIEADFTNLSADELSAKYKFNGLCIKNWKKVTDGTGLTSTLPTASYAGYTPYKMIYQLATPEISYLTPKATIPLYDTNTIVDTDTPSDCKADVTVGYKLKYGVTTVAGDITAPTPDYMSAVNSVSELGDKKGIVRSPNEIVNGNFANGTTGWNLWGNATLASPFFTINGNKLYLDGVAFGNGRLSQDITGSFNDKLYIAYKTTGTGQINIMMFDYKTDNNPTSVIYDTSIGTRTFITSARIGGVRVAIAYANGTEYVARTVDDVSIINLTKSFGAGNEPTKEQCDILFATWQDKASTQATLPTLRKIGAVADTYNPETGVLVQRIGKKVFDGTEAFTKNSVDPNNYLYYTASSNLGSGTITNGMEFACSHLKYNASTTSGASVGFLPSVPYNVLYMNLGTIANNLTQFKEYLAQQYANGTPVTVYYQLATPVVTTLATSALPTYKPTTVIESDSTIKGNVSADYKLKANATPVTGDFVASPECVNDIKDLGNSIDVVSSVGRRNLLISSTLNRMATSMTEKTTQRLKGYADYYFDFVFPLKPNTTYTVSNKSIFSDSTSQPNRLSISLFNYNTTVSKMFVGLMASGYSISFTTPANTVSTDKLLFYPAGNTKANFDIYELKVEEGATASPWTPAPEEIVANNTIANGVYKTNILLSAPLRSVGDVKDRLFKDSDGKWKVERNIGERIVDGTETWGADDYRTGGLNYAYFTAVGLKPSTDVISNTFPGGNYISSSYENVDSTTVVIFNVKDFRTGALPTDSKSVRATKTKNVVVAMGTIVQYILATPSYETLSQELQTELDNIPTFPEHNYVYTVTNDNLQPTLHVDYKKLSWLKSRLLLNSLKIYSRNLTDAELEQNYRIEKERYGM